jgi:hypothetical protein
MMNYNPIMNTQQRLAQMEQQYQQQNMFPTQMSGSLAGRMVDSFDSVTANDVPMDNSGAIFIKRDNSEIQHRIWNADGTIKMTSYKPVLGTLNANASKLSKNGENVKIGLSGEATEGIMNRFDTLESKIEKLEDILGHSQAPQGKKKGVRDDKSTTDALSTAD